VIISHPPGAENGETYDFLTLDHDTVNKGLLVTYRGMGMRLRIMRKRLERS
jgi:hypothetical protein